MKGIEIVKPLIYYRRGVRVDVVNIETGQDEKTPAGSHLYALKRNTPGFWDESLQDFVTEPLFLGKANQESRMRHSLDAFKREKEIMRKARKTPQLVKYIPDIIDTDDHSIATEYVDGLLLENINESGSLTMEEKLLVIGQLIDYSYWLHKVAIYHNDLHGRSIVVRADMTIKVIDYSMAGEENADLPVGWDDISRLNQNIIRTLVGNTTESIRSLTEDELARCGVLSVFLRNLPFDSQNYSELCEKYQRLVNL